MNKSRFLKAALAIAVIFIMATTLMVGTASASSVRITYKYGDFSRDEYVEAGKEFIPMSMDEDEDNIFYGWVDSSGNLYPSGQGATVASDSTLYLVSGCEVSSEGELLAAVESGKTYIKLTSNVGLYEQLCLDNGIFVIDTNGYTLTVNTAGDGIMGKGSGIVFMGEGAVNHNYMGSTPDFTMDSFIKLAPSSNLNTLFVTVCEGTTVDTPIDFISITSNIDRFDGVFSASIYGSLKCNKLMRTQGISGADFSVYETATVTTSCEFLFEDISSTTADRLVNFTVYGGKFYLSRFNSYAADTSKYQAAILGGYFSENITNSFPGKNYVFKYDSTTGLYKFQECNHAGPIIGGMPQTCTETNVVLTYKCQYCNTEYEDAETYKNGIGHFYVTEMIQPLIVTEELTQECINKTYCKRCGEVKGTETIYPNPSDTYVTVIYLDEAGKEHSLRVPASKLFDYDPNNSTYLKSFGTEYLSKEYQLQRKNIISVEIPLGTTKIYGSSYQHSATKEWIPIGVFYDNAHLREIVLPASVTQIEKNAFREMKELTSIKGLENVTGTIGTHAFYQTHTNVLIDQLELNASTIESYAFNNIRMNFLYIGQNVSKIESNAFHLDTDEENGIIPVNEIIVEGNTRDGITVYQAMGSRCSSSGHQFDSRNVVFTEHQCDVAVTLPTCTSTGYTTHTCKYCSYVLVDQPTATLEHKPTLQEFPSTCVQGAYSVKICPNCNEIDKSTLNIYGVPNENHSFTSKSVSIFYDEDGHMAYYQSADTAYQNRKVGYYDENGNKLNEDYYTCEDKYVTVVACDLCGIPNWSLAPTNTASWIEPSNAHNPDFDKMETLSEANCGDEGLGVAPCLKCSKILDIIIPVTGKSHSWDSGTMIKEATCVEKGIEEFRCTVCSSSSGVRQEYRDINPDNHSLDEGVVVREPTETAAGIRQFSCTNEGCDYTYTEGINKILVIETEFPVWAIVVISIGGVLLVGGVVLTLYFTLFKKKRASDKYKYKFNTLGK